MKGLIFIRNIRVEKNPYSFKILFIYENIFSRFNIFIKFMIGTLFG